MIDKNTVWQLIRSAPRDGTVIDLWCDDERLTNCFWKDYPYWKWWQQYAESPSNSFPVDGKADYWMPLPKPPGLPPDETTKAELAARHGIERAAYDAQGDMV